VFPVLFILATTQNGNKYLHKAAERNACVPQKIQEKHSSIGIRKNAAKSRK